MIPQCRSTSEKAKFSPMRCVNPRDLHDSMDFSGDVFGNPKPDNSSDLSSTSGSSDNGGESDPLNAATGLTDGMEGVEAENNVEPKGADDGEEAQPAEGVNSTEKALDSSDEDGDATTVGDIPSSSDLGEGEERSKAVDDKDPVEGSSSDDEEATIADDSNEAKDPLANSSDVEKEAPINKDSNEAMADLSEDEEVERAISGAAVESQEPSSGSLEGEESAPSVDVVLRPKSVPLLENGDDDQEMADAESVKQPSDKSADGLGVQISGGSGNGDEPMDTSEDTNEVGNFPAGQDSETPEQPAPPSRRSTRLGPPKKMPKAFSYTPRRVSAGKKKPTVKKHEIFPLVRVHVYIWRLTKRYLDRI